MRAFIRTTTILTITTRPHWRRRRLERARGSGATVLCRADRGYLIARLWASFRRCGTELADAADTGWARAKLRFPEAGESVAGDQLCHSRVRVCVDDLFA